MNKKVGLPPELVTKMNQTLSAGTVGEFYPGMQLDALTNGILAGFSSSMLLAYVDGVAGTKAPSRVIAATAGSGLGTLEEYMILGERGFWRVAASSTTAAGVAVTTGLYNTISTLPKTRGVFKAQLGDVNAAATCILDTDASNFLPVASSQDWEVEFGIAATTNTSQAATIGFAEFGVVEGAPADNPANAIGSYYAQFKIAGSAIVCRTETTANVKTLALPSGYLTLGLRYVASQKKVYFSVNGEVQGSATVHATMAAAQPFMRVSHLAAYTAATHAPLSVDLDYVVANAPLMDHQS